MELKMINGKYWGDNKIEGVTLSDRKTYLGKLIYKLTFDSGNFEEVTEENIGIGMTDEKSDARSLRNRLIDKMTEKIMGIMLEGEIKIGDVEYLKSKITGNVNFHQKRAEDILWGKDIYDINLSS